MSDTPCRALCNLNSFQRLQTIKRYYEGQDKASHNFIKPSGKKTQLWALCRLSLLQQDIGTFIKGSYNVFSVANWSIQSNLAFIHHLKDLIRYEEPVVVFFDASQQVQDKNVCPGMIECLLKTHLETIIASNLVPSSEDFCVLAKELYLLLDEEDIACYVVKSDHDFLLKLEIRKKTGVHEDDCKSIVLAAINKAFNDTATCPQQSGGGNKLLKVLGRYRKVHVMKLGRYKEKLVTYMGKLTPLDILRQKEKTLNEKMI